MTVWEFASKSFSITVLLSPTHSISIVCKLLAMCLKALGPLGATLSLFLWSQVRQLLHTLAALLNFLLSLFGCLGYLDVQVITKF